MTGPQYAKAIASLGLNQATAAEFLGVSLRSSHGYANGTQEVTLVISRLLRLMLRLGLDPKDVR